MELKEALENLSSGHRIITPEAAEEVCKAVGVPFAREVLVKRWRSDPPGTPKGLTMAPGMERSEGVYTLRLSQYVAERLGVDHLAGYLRGRGFQARAYAEQVAKKLGVTL